MLCRKLNIFAPLGKKCGSTHCHYATLSTKSRLTNDEVRLKRSQLFDEEAKRQANLIARYEKIQVKVTIPESEDTILIMNKKISTPYNCAMHISEVFSTKSGIALVNDKAWDMHKPLVEDCEIRFQHFKIPDPSMLNKIYWRSCCFLLGMIVERAFKNSLYVELHSWPLPDVRSGSFVYDVDMKVDNWKPREDELRTLSITATKLFKNDYPFQVLNVDASVALKIFEDNRFKVAQIPAIAAASYDNKSVTLYKVHDHIDISHGPMIGNTSLVGRFDVTAVFPLSTDLGVLHRFQGLSLPQQNYIRAVPYNILLERAVKVNPAQVPGRDKIKDEEFITPLHKQSNESTELSP